MKHHIIAAAILAATAAAPASAEWIVKSANNSTFEVLPSTVRSYANAGGGRQLDALVEADTAAESSRFRLGVTGCASGGGQVGQVDRSGQPTGQVFEWIADGSRVYDQLAMLVCLAAHRAGLIGDGQRAAPVAPNTQIPPAKKGIDL